ncbi:hypothetical protein KKE26_05545 [bacterium]|nr:hypothetical protein [bacterium]MBU1753412.1 hypothetical protein [bacterium]
MKLHFDLTPAISTRQTVTELIISDNTIPYIALAIGMCEVNSSINAVTTN